MFKYGFKSVLPIQIIVSAIGLHSYWAESALGIEIHSNQEEIINAVCDRNIENLAIIAARGSGKTFSVGVGLVKLCRDNPGLKVGIFAPKEKQANRIIQEITRHIVKRDSPVYEIIDWANSTKSTLLFRNRSEIIALSADATSQQEGWHFHVVVVDEAHRVEDESINTRIQPMLGSYEISKLIKIGIPVGKNHFYRSCNSLSYKVIKHDWTQCPILLKPGSILYEGVNKELNRKRLPKRVIDLMPLSLKKKMFPDRPDLHMEGELSEFDFLCQYKMEWADDVYSLLKKEDAEKLVSGTHAIMNGGLPGREEYFFGLDTASGSLNDDSSDLDFTVLSIWRRLPNNVKEKVFCMEWQGNALEQADEIKSLIHPKTGRFPCIFGIADYSNIAINMVQSFQKEGIPIEGIRYGKNEPSSGKNYKNAIFDNFMAELHEGRVKFPPMEEINKSPIFKKSYNEWMNIERHEKAGANASIQAPSWDHDDHPNSDCMGVYAATKTSNFKNGKNSMGLPKGILNGVPSINPMARIHQNSQKKYRYLKGQGYGDDFIKPG